MSMLDRLRAFARTEVSDLRDNETNEIYERSPIPAGVTSLNSFNSLSERLEPLTSPRRPVLVSNAPRPAPLLMRYGGRRLWRWPADTIPDAVPTVARVLADEARSFGIVLVGDGSDLVAVEPWLSNLPEDLRVALAADAGAVIALLRGESRARADEKC